MSQKYPMDKVIYPILWDEVNGNPYIFFRTELTECNKTPCPFVA